MATIKTFTHNGAECDFTEGDTLCGGDTVISCTRNSPRLIEVNLNIEAQSIDSENKVNLSQSLSLSPLCGWTQQECCDGACRNQNNSCQSNICLPDSNPCGRCTSNQECVNNRCIDIDTEENCDSCGPNQTCSNNNCRAFQPATGKKYIIENAESSLALVPLRETVHENFGEVLIWSVPDSGVSDQQWFFTPTTHGYKIQNAESGLSLVPLRETVYDNGGTLLIYDVEGDGVADQNWRLTPTAHGHKIQSVESGLSLVPLRETVYENGGTLLLYDVEGDGVADQNWIFREVR